MNKKMSENEIRILLAKEKGYDIIKYLNKDNSCEDLRNLREGDENEI